MSQRTLSKAATLIAVAMALVVGLLAILGSGAAGVVAAVGGLVVAALYVASGLLNTSNRR